MPQFQVLTSFRVASVRSPPIRKIRDPTPEYELLQYRRKYRCGISEISSIALPVDTVSGQLPIFERERRLCNPAIADIEFGLCCVRRRIKLHRPLALNGINCQGFEDEGLLDSGKGDLGRQAGGMAG